MDTALAIEAIVAKAKYFGITSNNTKKEFDDLIWLDSREKPTWQQLQTAYAALPTEESALQARAIAKAALLIRLGITADEAALLLS